MTTQAGLPGCSAWHKPRRSASNRSSCPTFTTIVSTGNGTRNPRFASLGNRPKVTRVWRRLVYLRGADMLLVADTVESTDPAFDYRDGILYMLMIDRFAAAGRRP